MLSFLAQRRAVKIASGCNNFAKHGAIQKLLYAGGDESLISLDPRLVPVAEFHDLPLSERDGILHSLCNG